VEDEGINKSTEQKHSVASRYETKFPMGPTQEVSGCIKVLCHGEQKKQEVTAGLQKTTWPACAVLGIPISSQATTQSF
jgi:hypothetical protein